MNSSVGRQDSFNGERKTVRFFNVHQNIFNSSLSRKSVIIAMYESHDSTRQTHVSRVPLARAASMYRALFIDLHCVC
jgi:hypothetical protein